MFWQKKEEKKAWRDGVYLCTVKNSLEADLLESRLRGEGIPVERRYKGAGNFLEIAMGANMTFPIDLYVPEPALEDARNIIGTEPIFEDAAVDFNAMSDEEFQVIIDAEMAETEDGAGAEEKAGPGAGSETKDAKTPGKPAALLPEDDDTWPGP